jgi:hypothetical protein
MNNPVYTWIKSVNAEHPINKGRSDKIRKCRLPLFFSFSTQETDFLSLRPSFVSVGRRWQPLKKSAGHQTLCLAYLASYDARKNARWSKRGGVY